MLFFHGPGIDQPVGFLMDQEGDCNFSTVAGFSEPALVLQTDGLGSVTSLINSTRAFFRSAYLAERVTYDAFGSPTFQNPGPDGRADTADDVFSDRSAFGHPYAFTGREWDPESGLYYYRARYYDPKLGRFLQEDPIVFSGGEINLYGYVLNNPLIAIDPFGEDTYYINNKFSSSTPTNSPVSHSFVALTDRDPVTGREMVTKTYSWVNTNGGEWEDADNAQNREGAQKAIDSGVGTRKMGGETLDSYVDLIFEEQMKEQAGGFWGPRGTCKDQANRLIDAAKAQMRKYEAPQQ